MDEHADERTGKVQAHLTEEGATSEAGQETAAEEATPAETGASETMRPSADGKRAKDLPPNGRGPALPEFVFDLDQSAQAAGDELVGRHIGRYRVEAYLHAGHLSDAYRAYDLKLDRPVYLKVIKPAFAHDPAWQARLLENVRAAAALDHPHIVPIYDYDGQADYLFVVSEFVTGPSIDAYVEERQAQGHTVSVPTLLEWGAQAAEALDYAHERGLVHGHLKPAHILLETPLARPQSETPRPERAAPRVKLVDFGIAQLVPDVAHLLPAALAYISPEQCRGESVDGRADIYALGVVLYELLTGRRPFESASSEEAIERHTQASPEPPSAVRPGVDSAVDAVILCALEKQPRHRFGTVREFGEALRTLRGQLEAAPESDGRVSSTNGAAAGVVRDTPAEPDHQSSREAPAPEKSPVDVKRAQSASRPAVGSLDVTRPTARKQGPGDLALSPVEVAVEAGERVDVQITLVNEGAQTDRFHVDVSGIPAEWLTLSNNEVQLMPGGRAYLLMTIQPPRDSSARAGHWPYRLAATPLSNRRAATTVSGDLYVRPFENLAVEMHPELIRGRGKCEIAVHNRGNTDVSLVFEARDAADEVHFDRPTQSRELICGASTAVTLYVRPLQRSALGAKKEVPFDVHVTARGPGRLGKVAAYVQSGRLEIQPLISTWLAAAVGLLIPLLCLLGVVGYTYISGLGPSAADPANSPAAVVPVLPTETPRPTPSPSPVPLPASCRDVKEQNPEATDGEYTLYLDRNPDAPVSIYCHNMEHFPTEYLSLANTGPEANFSEAAYPNSSLTTSFSKVRLNLRELTIEQGDRTFATTTGSLPEGAPSFATDYGVALGCGEGAGSAVVGRANIDLRGTPFALGEFVSFSVKGSEIFGEGIEMSSERQVVTMSIGGRCGWANNNNALWLDYLPTAAAQTEEGE